MGSWTAILAATALGIQGASSVRAEVKVASGEIQDGANYRLVVQSRGDAGRPIGAVQRVVTGAELRRGVGVNLVEIGASSSPTLVAWVDAESPDEHEGLQARPGPGVRVGQAVKTASGPVRIVLG